MRVSKIGLSPRAGVGFPLVLAAALVLPLGSAMSFNHGNLQSEYACTLETVEKECQYQFGTFPDGQFVCTNPGYQYGYPLESCDEDVALGLRLEEACTVDMYSRRQGTIVCKGDYPKAAQQFLNEFEACIVKTEDHKIGTIECEGIELEYIWN